MIWCSICGGEIYDKPSRDHVFPRSVYKWTEHYLPPEEWKRLVELIEDPDNQLLTHDSCNKRKEDEIPDLTRLYLSRKSRLRLETLEQELSFPLQWYRERKKALLGGQNGICPGCGQPITGYGVLRRIDPKQDRVWENACVVCHDCNTVCEAFPAAGKEGKK